MASIGDGVGRGPSTQGQGQPAIAEDNGAANGQTAIPRESPKRAPAQKFLQQLKAKEGQQQTALKSLEVRNPRQEKSTGIQGAVSNDLSKDVLLAASEKESANLGSSSHHSTANASEEFAQISESSEVPYSSLDLEPDDEEMTINLDEHKKLSLGIDDDFKKSLDAAIDAFEQSFINQDWADQPIAISEFVPALVELENLKKPGLNLVYCESPTKLREAIKQCIDNGTTNARFIVKREGEVHMAYFDYKAIENTPSILQMDSVSFMAKAAYILADDTSLMLEGLHQNLKFAGIDTAVQTSGSECSIFSLNLAKRLYKNPHALDEAHQRNASSQLIESDPYSISNWTRADEIIPPALMKHSQSTKRTDEYLKVNVQFAGTLINKKGDTLDSYQQKHRATEVSPLFGERRLVDTIFRKRLAYLQELRQAIS